MEGGVEKAAAAAVQFREGAFRLYAPGQRERQGQSSQSPPAFEGRGRVGRHTKRAPVARSLPLPPPWPSKVGANASCEAKFSIETACPLRGDVT